MYGTMLIASQRPWRRFWRALPPALLALAFVAGLAAAAPHSVHHLGEELEHRLVECPGVLAWLAASGTDCPAPIAGLVPPIEVERFTIELTFRSPSPLLSPHQGRAPPPTIIL